ncbi:MAG: ADP-glyceromanno-heptose 6-epimerase [Phycisphaerae bacterium]|nr:ADP-glyceromanno-heptose 6-epimerase [Phycisphaerae bacterium]
MIIVTGAAGFIGSAIVAQLNARGIDDILIVDQLGTDGRWKNLRNLRFADYIEKDDFLNLIHTARPPKAITAVFHMGACSSTTETDASYLAKNNFEYTKHLAQWAISENARFIYASSAATYGDGSKGFSDNETEIDQLTPLNMYGYSKQMFDLWARKAGLLDKLVGLKYFNVFGPNEYHKADMRSFILKSFEQINATGKVKLFKSANPDYGDGEYVRDFIYVKDAVDMTLFFMDNPDIGGIFNIGTGKARSWNDLVKGVFTAMDKKAAIEYVTMPDSIKNQYQYYTQADITKLRDAGFKKPTTTLEEAIKDYVQNYLQTGDYLGGK